MKINRLEETGMELPSQTSDERWGKKQEIWKEVRGVEHESTKMEAEAKRERGEENGMM